MNESEEKIVTESEKEIPVDLTESTVKKKRVFLFREFKFFSIAVFCAHVFDHGEAISFPLRTRLEGDS